MKYRTKGFSIVEIIVVIAIIGLIVGLVFPALKSARMRAKKTQELSLINQTGKAWTMYSTGHQGRILSGFLSTEVQQYRELAWAFPDESIVPPAPFYAQTEPNDAGPWPWRLLDYLDNDWRSLLFYREVSWDQTGGQLLEHADVIATEPAFGYNGYYLGGWWELDQHSERPKVTFGSVTLTDDRVVNVVSSVVSHIRKPSEIIVFCSTFLASPGIYGDMPNDTAGDDFAIPSVLARVEKWTPLGSGRIDAHFQTHVPLGRFNGMPAISFADGHTQNVDVETLVDQRMWIPKAQTIDDIPAQEFSHTQ